MNARSGLMTVIGASILLSFAASAATYIQYQSFNPCVWMEQDIAADTGLPRFAAKARIQTQFLIEGVTRPDAGQCVMAWWEFRAESTGNGS